MISDRGQHLTYGQRHHYVATVIRKRDKQGIQIMLDGAAAVTYEGPVTDTITSHSSVRPPHPAALGLGAWSGDVTFYKAELKMLDGEARKLK
jgi:hypothetical protein